MRTLLLAAALSAGLSLTACHRHHLAHHSPPHHSPKPLFVPPGRVVVIDRGHACHAHCGHYHHGGKVYHMDNHVHRSGCGHVLRAGIWVHVD